MAEGGAKLQAWTGLRKPKQRGLGRSIKPAGTTRWIGIPPGASWISCLRKPRANRRRGFFGSGRRERELRRDSPFGNWTPKLSDIPFFISADCREAPIALTSGLASLTPHRPDVRGRTTRVGTGALGERVLRAMETCPSRPGFPVRLTGTGHRGSGLPEVRFGRGLRHSGSSASGDPSSACLPPCWIRVRDVFSPADFDAEQRGDTADPSCHLAVQRVSGLPVAGYNPSSIQRCRFQGLSPESRGEFGFQR